MTKKIPLLLSGALALTACASEDAIDSQSTKEHAAMEQKIVPKLQNAVDDVRTKCINQYQTCMKKADPILAEAALNRALEGAACDKVTMSNLCDGASKYIYGKEAKKWDKATLKCEEELETCL